MADDDDDRPRKKKSPPPEEGIEDDERPVKKKPARKDDDEEDEDEFPRRSIKRSAPDDGGVGIVVPYRNGMALAAYYTGIFGLILCFLGGVPGMLGIVPVVLGIMGLRKKSSDPEAHGSVHAWVGICLGTLEVVTGCGVLGFFLFAWVQGR